MCLAMCSAPLHSRHTTHQHINTLILQATILQKTTTGCIKKVHYRLLHCGVAASHV